MTGSLSADEHDELDELADRFCREVREGASPDIEEYARRHPEHAADIRELFPALEMLERTGRNHLGKLDGFDETVRLRTLIEVSKSLGGEAPTSDVVERIVERCESFHRYVVKEEVARGGQGAIFRVRDTDLHRDLAMKVVLGGDGQPGTTPAVDSRTLGRFLEEAQVTGQLDHPGIVPVHELGIDDQGRVYFTMKLVKGEDLKVVFDRVHAGDGEWTRTRALGVMLKVCDAMAYAHAKGVIHRDLKPGNVMVGTYGEVYVMDWGLARVTEGRDDDGDPLRAETTERALATMPTMEGDVLGTPAYMAPEQAFGQQSDLGPHSDVYSVGAMIYHLLVGYPPHGSAHAHASNRTILDRVRAGPPPPVDELAPGTPQELLAICAKAMERIVSRRYPDMSALADDLRAYLEGRVVGAFESGAVAELKKWVKRNQALAGFIAATFVALVVGMSVSLVLKRRSDRRADEVLRLSALQTVQDLTGEVAELWPAVPDNVPRFEDWVERASGLAQRLPEYETKLAKLRAEFGDLPPDTPGGWWTLQQKKLVEELHGLERQLLDPEIAVEPYGWSVARRLRFATGLRDGFEDGTGEGPIAWEQASRAIADDPRYGGLRLEPQVGLVPLGPDPESGLWEFADLQTGELPARDDDGGLRLTAKTCVVFVLLPGGTFTMGAQSDGMHLANYDPEADLTSEYPPHEVRLDPFFLAKAEMTQGQWERFTGGNPSLHYAGRHNYNVDPGHAIDPRHPVENVSWHECEDVLARLGFQLPTETQWEYAARGGRDWPWWPGDVRQALEESANVADLSLHEVLGFTREHEDWRDGFAYHAPVGSFAANPYGLWDVHGNVWEWCLDWVGDYALFPVRAGDGLRLVPEDRRNVKPIRGGSFHNNALAARLARRATLYPTVKQAQIGLRPARALRPLPR